MRPDDDGFSVPVPAMLRHARGAYARSISLHVHEAGIDDLMKNGAYVLGGLKIPVHAGQLIREMGLSSTASSNLVGALLSRGFVEPGPGPARNGVIDLALTDKGLVASDAAADGVAAVNAQLAELQGPDELSAFNHGLTALIDIKERSEDADHSHRDD